MYYNISWDIKPIRDLASLRARLYVLVALKYLQVFSEILENYLSIAVSGCIHTYLHVQDKGMPPRL